MSIIRRRNHEVPSLNTASLPDLIFAILFFFMIVTHMRKVNLKVRYKTPQGTELTHLSRKTNTTYIFIGQPQQLTVCLKADRHAPMRVVEGVKMALRKANMLHVNYYATEKAPSPAANP